MYQQLNLIDGFKYVYMIVYVHLGKHQDSDTNVLTIHEADMTNIYPLVN